MNQRELHPHPIFDPSMFELSETVCSCCRNLRTLQHCALHLIIVAMNAPAPTASSHTHVGTAPLGKKSGRPHRALSWLPEPVNGAR